MAIDRTAWTALVNDDGTNTVGTEWTKDLVKTVLLDPIDARWSEFTTTATGNQDNFAYAEADDLRCNSGSTLTLRGLLAPAAPAKPAKWLVVYSVGAGAVVLNDQDVNSAAANRIITGTGAALALAAGSGYVILKYDAVAARWRVRGSSVVAGGGTPQFMFTQGGPGVQVQASTAYYGPAFQGAGEDNAVWIVTQPITITKLYAGATVVGGSGQTVTVTLRKNRADTAITCAIGSGATAANDTAHSVSFAVGDLISVKVVTSATTGNVQVFGGFS